MVKARHKPPKGIYGKNGCNAPFRAEVFFHLFGIGQGKLPSLTAAREAYSAMVQVKSMVDDHMKGLLLRDQPLLLEAHMVAVKKAIKMVRIVFPKVHVEDWHYYAKISEDGSECRRLPLTRSLDKALEGWKQMCVMHSIPTLEDMGTEGLSWRRQLAEDFAIDALKDKGAPSDQCMLQGLRLWGFEKNKGRDNVVPTGQAWVHSDTLGLIMTRGDRQIVMSKASVDFPNFVRLISSWGTSKLGTKFAFTSITVNKGYAARVHRDKNNLGPSVGIAAGSYDGGGLQYWPEDTKTGKPSKVIDQPGTVLNLRNRAAVFDGTCAHGVQPFEGERFSIIFFTMKSYEKAGKVHRCRLLAAGALWPSQRLLKKLKDKIVTGRLKVSTRSKKLKKKVLKLRSASKDVPATTKAWLKPFKHRGGKMKMPSLTEAIAFVKPNPKTLACRSGRRYARYMVATSIEEAFRRGAWRGDLENDFKKGYLMRGRRG